MRGTASVDVHIWSIRIIILLHYWPQNASSGNLAHRHKQGQHLTSAGFLDEMEGLDNPSYNYSRPAPLHNLILSWTPVSTDMPQCLTFGYEKRMISQQQKVKWLPSSHFPNPGWSYLLLQSAEHSQHKRRSTHLLNRFKGRTFLADDGPA